MIKDLRNIHILKLDKLHIFIYNSKSVITKIILNKQGIDKDELFEFKRTSYRKN